MKTLTDVWTEFEKTIPMQLSSAQRHLMQQSFVVGASAMLMLATDQSNRIVAIPNTFEYDPTWRNELLAWSVKLAGLDEADVHEQSL